MKKIAFLGVLALCMGFAACDEVEESTGTPQVNPQLPVFNAENLKVTVPENTALNLIELNAAGEKAVVADLTTDDFPYSEYSLKVVMEMAATDEFAKVGELSTTLTEDGQVAFSADEFNGVYKRYITLDPDQRDVNVRFACYAVHGTTVARLGKPGEYFGAATIKVTPFEADVTYEDTYYLAYIADGEEWSEVASWDLSAATFVKLDHSSKSVYDDPSFFLAINISDEEAEAGLYWIVVPESTKAAGTLEGMTYYGPAEDAVGELAGFVEAGAEFAGQMWESNPYMFNFDLQEETFEFAVTIENLFVPGDANGWTPGACPALFTTDYIKYYGFAALSPGGFKFTTEPSWDGTNYGAGADAGTIDAAGGNLAVEESGFYWVYVNLPELTYSATKIESLGVIGGLNGWGAQEALEPSEDFLTWTGEVTFPEPGEFKIRCNDDWGINLGGPMDAMTFDGPNMSVAEAGTYEVVLDLSAVPYSLTLTAK